MANQNSGEYYYRGTVEIYNEREGWGYIRPDDSRLLADLILVHYNSLHSATALLKPGQRVIFATRTVPTGLLAIDVQTESEIETDAEQLDEEETAFGKVKVVIPSQNHGLIQLLDGRDAYFHFSSLADLQVPPVEGLRVSCRIIQTVKGLQAIEVIAEQDERYDFNFETSPNANDTESPKPKSKEQIHPNSETRLTPIYNTESTDLLARAVLARDQRRYDDAVALYERGLKSQPSTPLILSYAAMEKNRNRKSEAMRIYEHGIRMFPNVAKLREDAGLLAMSLHQYPKAIELLKQALNLCRRDPNRRGEKGVLPALARAYYRMDTLTSLGESIKYYGEAVHAFGKASQMPDYDLLNMNIAQIRTQHHRGNLAVQFLRRASFQILRAGLLEQTTVGADMVVRIDQTEFLESYGLGRQMLVRCMFKSDVAHSDLEQFDKSIRYASSTGLADEQVALLIVSSVSENLQSILFKRIEEPERAPAIIPISQSVIESERNPLSVLRDVLDQWLYRRDLFAVNFPVVGRKFFGRDKPLAEMREAIFNGTPMGVFGLRKVGKTSLLKETERRASEYGDIVVYVDLLRVPSDINDSRWLYWKIASLLRERTSRIGFQDIRWRLGGIFEDFLDIPKEFSVATAFDADIAHLLKAIRTSSMSPRPRVVLLLDEIERLVPTALGKQGFTGFFDFFGYLRGVCQENNNFVVIVTGANAAISEAAQFDGRDNPVFNFFKEAYLQLLEPDETELMMRVLGRGMGIKFTPDASDYIYILAGGHPFFSRQLCSFVASERKERPLTITRDLIQDALEHYIEVSGKDFQEILARLSRDYPQEKEVCVNLAQAGGSLPLESITSDGHGGVSLRHLRGYQLVRVDKDKVRLSMDLLRFWLERRY